MLTCSKPRISLSQFRPLGTSRVTLGLFSRSPTPPPPPTPPPADLSETPLTPFQSRIAALETAALARPDSVPAQLDLLKALIEGNEYQGVIGYYETMALGSGGAVRSEALLKSDEAWSVYVEALAKAGRLGEVAAMVRKRDGLVGGATTTPTPTPTLSPTPPASLLAALPSTLAHTSSPSSSSSAASTALGTAATVNTASSGAGTPLSPIYVQLAPATPQANAWRAVRWVAGLILWMFVVLTVLSMVMENTGLLKAGPGPVEFEPEEGRVVKFSDVHGVEEAKAVSRAQVKHTVEPA
jgi:ATP-dependent metalloprotease